MNASYCFEDVEGFDQPGSARERLAAINPLIRVPTLVSPDDDVLTESGAIVLELAARYPEAGLVPARDSGLRAAFFNRLMWFNAVLYPTFTYRDYPERWAPSAADELVQSVDTFRRSLWTQLEQDVGLGSVMLGEQSTALDIYLSVMSHWRPGRPWFEEQCPRLHAMALRIESLPVLRAVIADNFPPSA